MAWFLLLHKILGHGYLEDYWEHHWGILCFCVLFMNFKHIFFAKRLVVGIDTSFFCYLCLYSQRNQCERKTYCICTQTIGCVPQIIAKYYIFSQEHTKPSNMWSLSYHRTKCVDILPLVARCTKGKKKRKTSNILKQPSNYHHWTVSLLILLSIILWGLTYRQQLAFSRLKICNILTVQLCIYIYIYDALYVFPFLFIIQMRPS